MTRQVGVLIEDVPQAVRDAVEADARERDVNRNDVVGQILADRFHHRWEPSGYPYREPEGSTQWNQRLTPELRDAIRRHAKARGLTQRGTILLVLQLHYGLPTTSAKRRPSHEQIPASLVREARDRHDAGESMRAIERDLRARGHVVKRETLAKAIRALAA